MNDQNTQNLREDFDKFLAQTTLNRSIPDEIIKSERIYYKLGNLAQKGMFWLAIMAFLSSLIVTSFQGNQAWQFALFGYTFDIIKAAAFIAALCSGLIGLLSLQSKNKDVWNAWRILNVAILRYKYDKEFSIKDLLAAYEAAEHTIGNVTINTK